MNKWAGLLQLPAFALEGVALDELELLTGGLLAPADGYCLPGHAPEKWPLEATLAVPIALGHEAVKQGSLLLTDVDGTPLAHLHIEDSVADSGVTYLAGPIRQLQPAEHPPERHLRLTAPPNGAGTEPYVLAAFSAEPTEDEFDNAWKAAQQKAVPLLLLAVAETPRPGDGLTALLETMQRQASLRPGTDVRLLVLPRYARNGRGVCSHTLSLLNAAAVFDYTADTDRHARGVTAKGNGLTVLLTGLSGSGKSTIARALAARLASVDHRVVTLLDGDDVRRMLSSELGFSRAERELNVRRIGWVAALIARTGGIAICAPIAPFEATRREVRAMAEEVGAFLLVHVSTPLEVCEARDRKGLYAKARSGYLPDFTGIDSPYEPPADADVNIDTSSMTVSEGVETLLNALSRRSTS